MIDPEYKEEIRRRELVNTLLMMVNFIHGRQQPGSLVSKLKANLDAEGRAALDSLTAKDFDHRIDS